MLKDTKVTSSILSLACDLNRMLSSLIPLCFQSIYTYNFCMKALGDDNAWTDSLGAEFKLRDWLEASARVS